jgi:hypothetical protein
MSELACTGDLGPQPGAGGFGIPAYPRVFCATVPRFRTRVHDGGGSVTVVDDLVVTERGVLTMPAEAWELAARRAEVVSRLVGQRVVAVLQ